MPNVTRDLLLLVLAALLTACATTPNWSVSGADKKDAAKPVKTGEAPAKKAGEGKCGEGKCGGSV